LLETKRPAQRRAYLFPAYWSQGSATGDLRSSRPL